MHGCFWNRLIDIFINIRNEFFLINTVYYKDTYKCNSKKARSASVLQASLSFSSPYSEKAGPFSLSLFL